MNRERCGGGGDAGGGGNGGAAVAVVVVVAAAAVVSRVFLSSAVLDTKPSRDGRHRGDSTHLREEGRRSVGGV